MAPKAAPGPSERAHDYKAHFLRARKRYDEVTAKSGAPLIGRRLSSASFRARSNAIAELTEARKRGVRLDFGRRSASVNGERAVTESHSSPARERHSHDASREGTQDTAREEREAHQARRSLYYSSEESDAEQGDKHTAKMHRKDAHVEARSSEADLGTAQVKAEQDTSNHSLPSPQSPSGSQKRPRPAARASEQGDASIEDDLLDASNAGSPKRQRTQ